MKDDQLLMMLKSALTALILCFARHPITVNSYQTSPLKPYTPDEAASTVDEIFRRHATPSPPVKP